MTKTIQIAQQGKDNMLSYIGAGSGVKWLKNCTIVVIAKFPILTIRMEQINFLFSFFLLKIEAVEVIHLLESYGLSILGHEHSDYNGKPILKTSHHHLGCRRGDSFT